MNRRILTREEVDNFRETVRRRVAEPLLERHQASSFKPCYLCLRGGRILKGCVYCRALNPNPEQKPKKRKKRT